MILIAIGILVGAPILWTVSVGAVREARLARTRDPRSGCQAWVEVPGPGMRGRHYRCGEPRYAGGAWCRLHEVQRARGTFDERPDALRIDEHQAVGRAMARARIGVPLAGLSVLATAGFVVWAVGQVL